MIDKAAFIGMNGAQASMHRLEVLTNNLANINTTGFRADFDAVVPYKVNNDGMQSRTYTKLQNTYTDFTKANDIYTGRELDVAMAGEGFISVQSKSGKEGYTRDGALDLDAQGNLITKNGEYVIGVSGIINIPPAEKVHISEDGTVSAKLIGATDVVTINRIKLANPKISDLRKGEDGLFYTKAGSALPLDPNLRLVTGTLEGSNVNAVTTLTELIDLSRHYEMHTNLLKTMSENASNANKLLDLPR